MDEECIRTPHNQCRAKKKRRRPTLPRSCPRSIIGAEMFHFWVRYGIRWVHFAIITSKLRNIRYSQLWSQTNNIHYKTFDQLVFLSYTAYTAYTRNLSTSSCSRGLIDKSERSNLGVGFPLRCFQRLSLPYIATLRCSRRHNRYTRGTSIPVLSY